MKRILLFALPFLVLVSCRKFDDSAIWEELNKHEDRIAKLEILCNQMNTNITSLQTIIIALQSNDYIVNIAPVKEGDKEIGYTITFSKSGSITIYHGKDGIDGNDGQDGYNPEIGVRQYSDEKYYWTIDGNWLLDNNGNMIPTTGENGKDGVSPQIKIENMYWYISYDNGTTWVQLDKATSEDGGSIFGSVIQDNEYVYFNLVDGTMISLPKHDKENIQFEDLRVKAICCKNWDTNNDGELSYAEAAAVKDIGEVFSRNTDIVAFTEFKFFTGVTTLSAKAFTACVNLWKITIPENVVSFEDGNADGNIYPAGYDIVNYAKDDYGTFLGTGIVNLTLPERFETIGASAFQFSSLKNININNNLKSIKNSAFAQCYELNSLELPDGLTMIGDRAFSYCTNLTSITIPETVISIGIEALYRNDQMPVIYCKPTIPPACPEHYSDGPLGYSGVSGKIIYVPTESVDAYKVAEGWKHHKNLIYGYDYNQ